MEQTGGTSSRAGSCIFPSRSPFNTLALAFKLSWREDLPRYRVPHAPWTQVYTGPSTPASQVSPGTGCARTPRVRPRHRKHMSGRNDLVFENFSTSATFSPDWGPHQYLMPGGLPPSPPEPPLPSGKFQEILVQHSWPRLSANQLCTPYPHLRNPRMRNPVARRGGRRKSDLGEVFKAVFCCNRHCKTRVRST
jgi:hypothetical protein